MIFDFEQIHPEQSKLRQDLSFVGNTISKNPVECAYSVCGYDNKLIAQIVNITHFPSSTRKSRDLGFSYRQGQTHEQPPFLLQF